MSPRKKKPQEKESQPEQSALITWKPGPATYPRNKNPVKVYLATQSPASRASILSALQAAALLLLSDGPGLALRNFPKIDLMHVAWPNLCYEHLIGLRGVWRESFKPATVNFRLSILKGVARQCFLLGHIGAEQWARIQQVKGLKRDKIKHGRQLSFAELDALIRVCESNLRGTRDRAIIVCLYGAALRRAELCGLDVPDYLPSQGMITVWKAQGGAADYA